jgi:hypothetical protein
VIARFHRGYALADLANDARAFMAEDRWKESFAVSVTDPRRLDLDQDFTGFRPVQIKLDDFERLLCFECDSSARLHSQLRIHFSICRHLQVNITSRISLDHFLPMQAFSAWV